MLICGEFIVSYVQACILLGAVLSTPDVMTAAVKDGSGEVQEVTTTKFQMRVNHAQPNGRDDMINFNLLR
jgi:hypothetical protein